MLPGFFLPDVRRTITPTTWHLMTHGPLERKLVNSSSLRDSSESGNPKYSNTIAARVEAWRRLSLPAQKYLSCPTQALLSSVADGILLRHGLPHALWQASSYALIHLPCLFRDQAV